MIIVREFKKKEAVLGLSWDESREVQAVKMEGKSFVKEGRELNLKQGAWVVLL